MYEVAKTIIYDKLANVLDVNTIEYDSVLSSSADYTIFHPDIIRNHIQEAYSNRGMNDREAIIKADEILNDIEKSLEEVNVLQLDSWAGKIESQTCANCPAFQWVIHRQGIHSCRLGFKINESNNEDEWIAVPVHECIRPNSVGASYLISKQLNRSEPMVGKLDAKQFEQYVKEKEQLCH